MIYVKLVLNRSTRMNIMNSKMFDQWENLSIPKAENKKSVINVKGTNAWLFKDYLGTIGFMLSGVSLNEKFPQFENLTIKNKKNKIVERSGLPNLSLKNCLEIHLEPFCDSDLLVRILDTLSIEEPSGRFESSLLLDVIKRVLELVKRSPKPPSKQEVIGAWGELSLLYSFIKSTNSHYLQSRLVSGWEASPTDRSIIDFLFPFLGNGIAIEAKTSTVGRLHHFHGLPQVTIPEGYNHGWIASLIITEHDSTGKTCSDLVSSIKKEFSGTEKEIANILGDFVLKILTRGTAATDERFRFLVENTSLEVIEMSEVPRPILSPGVKEVEWSAELDNCPAIDKSTVSTIFPELKLNLL
jgi:hypothetical protein